MPISYHSSPREFRGKGTVWLAEDPEREALPWFGYWDLEPDGPPTPLEEGPGWASPKDAVAWGRARTPRVLIRYYLSRYFWAGEGPVPEDADIEGVFPLED